MNERGRQNDFLLHAFRKRVEPEMTRLAKAEQAEQFVASLPGRVGIEMMESRDDVEELRRRQRLVDDRLLGHVAKALLRLERLLDDVESSHQGAAGRGAQQTRQDLHGRRLAGAVGTEQSEHFSGLNAQVQLTEGRGGAVGMREIDGANHPEAALA